MPKKWDTKVVSKETFVKIKKKIANKKIVLVGGDFDIFHFGHLEFLKFAKEKGEILIIALESDKSLTIRKKRDPIHTQDKRAQVLAALSIVDFVILLPYFSKDSHYYEFTKTVSPSFIVVTKGDPQLENKKKQAKLVKAKVLSFPQITGFSSTKFSDYAPFPSN
ncbi:adenylyltransferase/cytidyltransferase family protein [Candidatus Roizmanbacteria bacterium]|nr:adenylyltransferase/cytidyltransferase family protein [Candidatus Roizmanbacteria bacterium]